ncbi:hypothetical protein EDD18DRAFT_1076390, partial [Armillaria luteobubalina]
QVENTFEVPRYHFESFSEFFKTMFTLPHGDGVNVDGSSDEYPLVLQGVKAQGFRSLLNVMLHPSFRELPLLATEAWLDVLKLSNMWRLVNIRNLAIRELSNRNDISFVDNIVWGRCYKVAAWITKGYVGLINRGDVVSLEEGVRIGMQATLGIWENTLFNVPRYHFENFSEVFKTMFSLPQSDDITVDGSSDEHPLVLQGVKAQEFRSLLGAMLLPEPPLSKKEAWIAVLKLSNMWRLLEIRKIALRQLNSGDDKLSRTEKIVWGDYKVADWVITGYCDLVDLGQVLSLDEGAQIGVPGVLGIWRSQNVSRAYTGYNRRDTKTLVLEVFGEEIKEIRREEAEYDQVKLACPAPQPAARPAYTDDPDDSDSD